jgi:hypothetical protein
MEDSESLEAYLNLIRQWMRDTTSLVAVSLKSGRIVGTVIARINRKLDKTNTYSRVQVRISAHKKYTKYAYYRDNNVCVNGDFFFFFFFF